MPLQQVQIDCPLCQRPTLHARDRPNHLVHGLVTLFLCGLWIPVWIFASWSSNEKPFLCQTCGTATDTPARSNSLTEKVSIGFVLLALAFVLVMILVYAPPWK